MKYCKKCAPFALIVAQLVHSLNGQFITNPALTSETAEYDTLLHLSSETETALRSINTIFLYYFLLTGGGGGKQPAFISLNQLTGADSYDGISKYSVSNVHRNSIRKDFTNYHPQYLQGYTEIKNKKDYVGVSLDHAIPISKNIWLRGKNGNWCYLTKYRRYIDSKEFYFIQMTQYWAGYKRKSSYKAISELLMYIKENYPGEYIFTGDFNVQGHEKVFAHHLGEDKYHICPFYKYVTCNDNEGVASPDGIVVSKALYDRVEYAVSFYPGYNYQHFIVSAKLYPSANEKGMFSTALNGFVKFLDVLATQHGKRSYYVGDPGIFNSSDSSMIGSVKNIKEEPFKGKGPRTITSQVLSNKIKRDDPGTFGIKNNF